MINLAIVIWVLTTQHFSDDWTIILALAVIHDLFYLGYRVAKS